MDIKVVGAEAALERINGFHQYCLEQPRHLRYANGNLCRMLGVSQAQLTVDTKDGYARFLHPEDREEYERFLRRLYVDDQTLSLQYRLVDSEGRIFHVIDTAVSYSEQGRRMADSTLTDITGQQKERSGQERGRYLRALSEVYDKIFEFDRRRHKVKCLYGQNSPSFKWLENVEMDMETATENWVTSSAVEEDREKLSRFFADYMLAADADERPARIFYHARSSDGVVRPYTGIFLRLDEDQSLYCCRCCQDEQEAEELRRENDSLKNVQELALRFTEGMVAFEIEDNRVRPLYSSKNMYSFFGFSRKEWRELMVDNPTIRDFIRDSGISLADIQMLFSKGEAEFSYFDIEQNAYRRIKAICSRKYDGTGKCYVMLYRAETPRPEASGSIVHVRTFGYFDVFVGEKPIAFRNEKAKELLALLVDRKGGFVSSEEAIGFLWEDESANQLTLSRYRKVALRLKNTLEEYGVADILENVNGKRRLIPERVQCDLYDYLSGAKEYEQLFKGSYLTNYSWAESTMAELTGQMWYEE
ncbi:MAG: PAS domain-containing protein [Lachnospiraceae bacterium]|nr:PAS domain-containing protein [Lachnospiraceae bacterium]